jgi:hypothetical protein
MKERIGILCGFAAEAAIAQSLSSRIAMSGAIEQKAANARGGLCWMEPNLC